MDTYIEVLTNKDELNLRYDKITDEDGSRSVAFIIWFIMSAASLSPADIRYSQFEKEGVKKFTNTYMVVHL